ncbi:DsbA family protein [Klebsiella pneumoniae]|uniref:DsbA family protein n=1 Tax=Klebsiella pneumoniae TaxID=573 RepID=UPI001BAD16CA|nr:DsbA family protein [Klebsiella pneumoniae]MBQ5265180.1 DsbA family protein [Klebsiella pneumoniae]
MSERDSIIITYFTDPMMGLSYESEPFFRQLETHFPGLIRFRYIMSGLVRDVYDFVDPADLEYGKAFALEKYNARLARIYKSEEYISGMPINMTGFRLFSPDASSSLPLNLAFKAAQLAAPEKAERFLYRLRFATIVESRPTIRTDEIFSVVSASGIDPDVFRRHYTDGSAQRALNDDIAYFDSLNINSLPAFIIEYQSQKHLLKCVLDYSQLAHAINTISRGEVMPIAPRATSENIRKLLDRHPLISPKEIGAAFCLDGDSAVLYLLSPLLNAGEIVIKEVVGGWFIELSTHNK